MSISTHVIGFRPPDAEWHRMKAVVDACHNAKIDVPDNVWKFFNYQEPDETGISMDLEGIAVEWSDGDMCSGLEIDLNDIPSSITTIRFYNSY